MSMNTIGAVLGGICLFYIIGCVIILYVLDDKRKSLSRWIDDNPYMLRILFRLCWPFYLLLYIVDKAKGE